MDYITIAEYAKRAGISKQKAYSNANREEYKKYFRRDNGRIMVDSALLDMGKESFVVDDKKRESAPQKAKKEESAPQEERKEDSALLDMLKGQLEAQHKQIESLYLMIAEKDSIIKDLSANMAQITATIQALQHEQNLLEAGKIQAETPPPPPVEEPKEKEEREEPPKKGLFSRFWRR